MARLAILTAEFAPFRGGIGTYVQSLASASASLGHEVTVFAPDYGATWEAEDARQFTFCVKRFPAGAFGPRWYPRYAGVAMRVVRGNGFEQVLAADIPFIELLAATQWIYRKPYTASIHGSEVKRSGHTLRGMMFAPANIFSKPAHIYANSRFTRQLLLENYPAVSAERVSVAYLGVADAWFNAADPGCFPGAFPVKRN